MVKAIVTILIKLLTDEKLRNRVLIAIGSVIIGFILLLAMPIIVLYSLGDVEIETPEIDRSAFNESTFIAQLSPEQQEQIEDIRSAGEAIESEMAALGIAEQTIKAQLIYHCKNHKIQKCGRQTIQNNSRYQNNQKCDNR